MTFEKILKSKIIRPINSTTLGMHIRSIEHSHLDKYSVNVRYFSMASDLVWGDKDTFLITKEQLFTQFHVIINPEEMSQFKDAKWMPVSKAVQSVKEYLSVYRD